MIKHLKLFVAYVVLAPWVGAFIVNNFINVEKYAFPITTSVLVYIAIIGLGSVYFSKNAQQLKNEWDNKEASE